MSEALWCSVDDYLRETLFLVDPVLDAALDANAAAGLPAFDVSPAFGRFLQLLARMRGSKRILEVGTLGGFSTIWLARALPAGGALITLEFDSHHAAVARNNIARAGLSQVVEVRVGPAAQSLAEMHRQGAAAFDMIFIDADKRNNPAYLEWAMKLSRPGTLIVVDNAVREGEIANAANDEPNVTGTRKMFEMAAADPRLEVTALQTVGAKGYDGFAMMLVLGGD